MQPSSSRSSEALARFRQGQAAYAADDLSAAIEHFKAAVTLDPRAGPFHRALGLALWQKGDRARGKLHLERALALDPRDAEIHEKLSLLQLESGEITSALRHAEMAVRAAPASPDAALALATVLEADRKIEPARQIVERLLAGGYRSPRLAFVLGRMASRIGKEREALTLIEQLLGGGALPHLRTEISLRFLAAQLLDRAGRYDEAFSEAARARELVGTRYDRAQFESYVDRHVTYFTRAKLAELPRASHGSSKPLFIVGMPRCGSTLVEQILSCHPNVHGAGELGWMFTIAQQAGKRTAGRGLAMPSSLDLLSQRDVEELSREYIQPLTALNPVATYVADKHLANFLNLGLIALLFPEARILHCRRDPLDTCLSCFMNEFVGYDLGSDLAMIGHFYRQYERLMAHWSHVLDSRILEVAYESVVGELEGQTRRILSFLDLPWEPRCVRFHDNARFIGTASNRQVSQPIYGSSVQRWRHYEKHLEPLRAALK